MKSIANERERYFIEGSELFKILSSPIRLKLINYISHCPRSVESCAVKFEQSIQNISLHLLAMAKAGILAVEKHKNYRIYSLAQPLILELLSCHIISEPRQLLKSQHIWSSGELELAKLVKAKKVALVDLREAEESEHIPVHKSYTYRDNESNLNRFLKTLPDQLPAVFFCRGAWCERMATVVNKANRLRVDSKGAGFNILQLDTLNQFLS